MRFLKPIGAISVSIWLLGSIPIGFSAEVSSGNSESSKLHALFDKQWERDMQNSPVWASTLGDRRFNRNWSDLSAAAFAAYTAGDKLALSELSEIDRGQLPREEQVNYDLFKLRYEDRIKRSAFSPHLIPISQRGGIQTLNESASRLRLKDAQDFDDWLSRLEKLDELMDQTIALMDEGVATGMLPPKATMQRVPAQIAQQLVDKPEDSLFYDVFRNMPQGIPASDATRIQSRAREVIASTVIPAYRRLNTYFNNVYYPACRTSFGVSDLPNGKRYYEYLVKRFTTTDMTPDEVHQIGLNEVKRIRSDMEAAISESGFKGDFDAFVHFLRTDPQFYYDTPEALFEGYLAMSKRLDPMLVDLFGKLPRIPYGLKKIPDVSAPDTTTAYYSRPAADGSRAGYYYVNLYKPETRPKWEMAVLSVHESVPGHHLQIALQQELEQLPNFRRYSGFTVFVEGWGLYSERLGYDMGLYEDPYDRFGQLTYDMWRAVRLVVDTGMHYKGWSRQRAIDYFKSNAPKSELDIINEIDRYISMPGQALAYKIGQLKILELRAEAEQRLGEKFDIRAFHDVVLGSGAIPLDVLQTNVHNWLEQQSQGDETGVRF